jgi:hypothetical protein
VTSEAQELFGDAESLIKSSERVRDLAEVFTPYSTIEDMLDLLPLDTWDVFPQKTFLEPACGNGNFLVVVFFRKAQGIYDTYQKGELPAGESTDSYVFHLLAALSSIYGVDISEDNVRGHLDDSHDGAHFRMELFFRHWLEKLVPAAADLHALFLENARWIIESNILVGNMLDMDTEGKPTNNRQIPFLDFQWDAKELGVRIEIDTFGNMLEAAMQEGMFAVPEGTTEHWSGTMYEISSVPRVSWKPRGIHKHEKIRT